MDIRAAAILQIIPRLDTGGAEMATCEISDAVVAAGGRALVFTEGGRMADDVTRVGGEIVPFPAATKNPARIIANAFRLARVIRDDRADLIHARSRAPAWSAYVAAKMTGTPFVTTYHGAYSGGWPLKNVYNGVMARGDIVIANSNYTRDLIRTRHGTDEARIRVIYRGVDLARLDPAAVDPERIARLRAAWGLGADRKIILHAARLADWKGHRYVIDAAAELAAQDTLGDAVIVMAGDAQGREAYVARLERHIAAKGLEDRVHLVGHCDDMAAAYSAATLSLVPSTEPEAFGRAAVEAQAMECPVIATKLGATPETVATAESAGPEGATGWLVPAKDASALGRTIAAALALPDDARAAMGRTARARAGSKFSGEAMKTQTLAVYDELLRSALEGAYKERAGRTERDAKAAGAA